MAKRRTLREDERVSPKIEGEFAQKRLTATWQRIWPSCGNYDQMTRSQHEPTVNFVMLELPEGQNLCFGEKKIVLSGLYIFCTGVLCSAIAKQVCE